MEHEPNSQLTSPPSPPPAPPVRLKVGRPRKRLRQHTTRLRRSGPQILTAISKEIAEDLGLQNGDIMVQELRENGLICLWKVPEFTPPDQQRRE